MYNSGELIIDTLDSIKKQTFTGKIEVICIDDCSTDNTVSIVEGYRDQTGMVIKILKQPKNQRQGAARNRGIIEAEGDYIFFVDSDDFLDENTFAVMYEKTKGENFDFILCDWAYYYEDEGEVYVNNDLFLSDQCLRGDQCEKLYQANSYFTVNKLYKRDYLVNNQISYGEGYIYEDFEFYVDSVQKANNIGIISNPFYKVRVSNQSVTKSNSTSTIHMEDFLTAVKKSLSLFNPRYYQSFYMVYKYFFGRAQIYSENRVPKKYKKHMIKKTVETLNERSKDYYVPKNIALFNYLYFKEKLIQNYKINTIMIVRALQKKGKLNKYYKIINRVRESKWNKKRRTRALNKIKARYKSAQFKNDTILFLGFDYRYIGNSKYLFDYFVSRFPELKPRFVTNNTAVPSKYRIKPRSLEFWKALGESRIFISESWTPLAFYKKEGSLWLQLWHGTPFKRMFFDSHEKFIAKHNRNHKRNKKKDISKWDHLLADSDGASNKFKSAFSISESKILPLGYPRVQWLKDNKDNLALQEKIKSKLNIPINKKVILYTPTWRDYNYKNNKPDFGYLLNLERLVSELGDEFAVVAKLHSMEKYHLTVDNVIIPPNDIETQELLLIADTLISDYSSIIFDVLPLNKDFLLYINDRKKFTVSRGAYEDIENLLKPFTLDNESEIINLLKNDILETNHPNYEILKGKYSNSYNWNSNEKIAGILMQYLREKQT
jgi:CDP-glycerol glycerophosphotransferase (TagB/SpsB family)